MSKQMPLETTARAAAGKFLRAVSDDPMVRAADDVLEALRDTLAAMRGLRALAFTGSRIPVERYPEKAAADAAELKARAAIAKASHA